MARIAKIHLVHTTSTRSNSDTDGQILFNLIHAGSTHRFPVNNLPHDEREKNRTDHYKIDVFDKNIDDGANLTCRLETASTDGWLPKSVYVIAQNVDGKCKLIAAESDWSSSRWLDKPSKVFQTISASRVTTAERELQAIHLLQTTSTKSSADSDGAIYLDVSQNATPRAYRLDTPNDDFEKGRSGEFVLNTSAQNFRSNDNLQLELRTTSTDGWLPNDVFVIGKHTDGSLKLLAAAPSWPRSQWIDHPGTPVRAITSPYPDTNWRTATTISEGTYYNLKSMRDDWQIGAEGNSYFPTNVVLNQDAGHGANQWRFKKVSNGKYMLIDRVSGAVLTGQGLGGHKLRTVFLPDADANTHFVPQRQADGTYVLKFAGNTAYGIAVKGSTRFKAELTLSTSPDKFDLIPIRNYVNPEAPANTTQAALAPASNLVQEIAVGLAAEMISTAVPGGGTLFAIGFSEFFGGGPDYEEMFARFRVQLLAEVHGLISETQRNWINGWLESIQLDYLISYMGERRHNIDNENALAGLADDAHDIGSASAEAITNLLPTFDHHLRVIDSEFNLRLIRTTFPIYLMGAVQAITAYQEAALITAVHPTRSLQTRYDTIEVRANLFLRNIRAMYDAILADRLEQIEKETAMVHLSGTPLITYHWQDNMINKKVVDMGPSSGSAYFTSVKDAYLENLEHSYSHYLYKYSEVETMLSTVKQETMDRCARIRSNAAARQAFIDRAKAQN